MYIYLANSASCFGSLKSRPGMPPGGSFLPVMYSVKSASDSETLESSSSLTLSSPTKLNKKKQSTKIYQILMYLITARSYKKLQ